MGFFLIFFTFAKRDIFFSGLQKLFCYNPLENPITTGCVASAHRNLLFPLKLFPSKFFIAPNPITEQKKKKNQHSEYRLRHWRQPHTAFLCVWILPITAAANVFSIWSSHMVSGPGSSFLAGALAIGILKTGGLSSLDSGICVFRTHSSDVPLLCPFFDAIKARCVDHWFLSYIFPFQEFPAE